MKRLTILLSVLLLGSTGAAQSVPSQPNDDVGWIGADHPLYFLETSLVDPARQSLGQANSSELARERMAEAKKALSGNSSQAAQNALTEYTKITAKAQGLKENEDVRALLEDVKQLTPENTDQGLATAIENATRSTEQAVTELSETGNSTKDLRTEIREQVPEIVGR